MTTFLVIAHVIVSFALLPAQAAEPQHCVRAEIVLWGDGRHDDSAALNAWLGGAAAIWAESGEPVGAAIAGHSFRLLWPERGETVSGGSIVSGSDPAKPPIVAGVSISGGDAGEGVPFETPDDAPTGRDDQARCAIS